MADLLTFYDDDEANTFIDCTICKKRIRGESQYKIHLTTLRHLKKEEVLADSGLIPRPAPLPEWTDIKQYLQYLKLDEPIIGLSSLVQEEDFVTDDGKTQKTKLLKYRCRMCVVEMDLCSMACHIIGRKHRQNYLQLKRPDLVTWQDNAKTQPGLVAKAKAAVVEKQEGWGDPEPLKRPKFGRSLTKSYQGHEVADSRNSDAQGRSLGNRYMEEQSSGTEDNYRQSYSEHDSLRRPSRYQQDNTHDGSYRENKTSWESYPEDDRRESPYSRDARQRRTYAEDSHTERSSQNEYVNLRYYTGKDDDSRSYFDEDVPGKSHFDERWNERGLEGSTSIGRYSNRDAREDFYQDTVAEDRFGDAQQRGRSAAQDSVNMGYREDEKMQGHMYMSHEGRGSSTGEMPMLGRNFQYEEKGRKDGQNFMRTRSGSFEGQGYTQRRRDALDDVPVPAKRKRKSRFSDATAEEMMFARKCQIEALLFEEQQKREAALNQQQGFVKRGELNVTHTPPSSGNVLHVLNDLKIENVEEANFLKEKLCTLLKEFNAKKAQEAEKHIRDYNHASGTRMEQFRDVLEVGQLDGQGFNESARYEHDAREFQKSRSYIDDLTGVQKTQRFEESSRDFQETGHFVEDHRRFQKARQYENDTVQEPGRYRSDPTDFQGQRHFESHSTSFQQERGFKDTSRNFDHTRLFDSVPTSFQQAGASSNSPRDFRGAGLEQDSRSFQSMRSTRGSEESRDYEEYEQASQGQRRHTVVPREPLTNRYSEDDFKHSQSTLENDCGFEWGPNRGGSAERSADLKTYYPEDKRRGLRESFRTSSSFRGEERVYAGSQTQGTPHQHGYHSGEELYDPFNPSASPPPSHDMPNPSSLEKLASTLLELVARKST